MCLYVENDDYYAPLDSGMVKAARKSHRCDECGRTIEPGESYLFWKGIDDGDFVTTKMCAHCRATIDLGAALTGCPKNWYWTMVHSLDDDGGFVGNILLDAEHTLRWADQFRMLRRVAECKRWWRRPNGELYPLPKIPTAAGEQT